MSIKKNNYSVAKVLDNSGRIIGYLSNKDIESGLDINLDLQGYTIIAL